MNRVTVLRCACRDKIFPDFSSVSRRPSNAALCHITCSEDDHETLSPAIERLLASELDLPSMRESHDVTVRSPILIHLRPKPPFDRTCNPSSSGEEYTKSQTSATTNNSWSKAYRASSATPAIN